MANRPLATTTIMSKRPGRTLFVTVPGIHGIDTTLGITAVGKEGITEVLEVIFEIVEFLPSQNKDALSTRNY
jgi:hypothetical protein